mmetsp:Transcript_34550/g.80046  ORF Transcript_34550/g.80046 Transcript_34550/m.80046 type:complete len:619 (+) Transcript_34550:250-2106(+)
MSEPDKKKQRQAPLHLAVKLLGDDDSKFVNDSFSLQVFLQDESANLKTGGADVPLKLSLVFDDQPGNEPQASNGKLLVVEGKGGAVIKNGRAEVKVKVMDVSMNYDNRKFCIVATSAQSLAHIAPGRSHGVTVIKHRLVLAQEGLAAWEADWYKDEGGRDKSIPLHIQLLDAKGRLVRDRSLPLKVTLHYEKTYLSVTNQEYLKLSPDSTMMIENGEAHLRVRIEDVSKNHQGQAFVISVGPDPKEPLDHDVNPAFSDAVTVKSKRNKRHNRKKDSLDVAQGSAHTNIHMQPLDGPSTASIHHGAAAEHTAGAVAGAAAAYAAPSAAAAEGGGEVVVNEVDQSLKTIFKWINKVLTDLPQMRWIEQPATLNPDGTVAMKSQTMPFPNDHIAEIIQIYQSETMISLQVLLDHLDRLQQMQQAAEDPMDTDQEAAKNPQTGGDGGDGSGGSSSSSSSSSNNSNAAPSAVQMRREPSDGLGPMPPSMIGGLQRQASANYFGPGTSSADVLPTWMGTDQTYTDNGVTESSVYFIVAKVFTLKTAQIGCPAFDAQRNLLGFFLERENDNSHQATDIDFIPLASLRGTSCYHYTANSICSLVFVVLCCKKNTTNTKLYSKLYAT